MIKRRPYKISGNNITEVVAGNCVFHLELFSLVLFPLVTLNVNDCLTILERLVRVVRFEDLSEIGV